MLTFTIRCANYARVYTIVSACRMSNSRLALIICLKCKKKGHLVIVE